MLRHDDAVITEQFSFIESIWGQILSKNMTEGAMNTQLLGQGLWLVHFKIIYSS